MWTNDAPDVKRAEHRLEAFVLSKTDMREILIRCSPLKNYLVASKRPPPERISHFQAGPV